MSICLCDNCLNRKNNIRTFYHEEVKEDDVLDSCDNYDPDEDMQKCAWCYEMYPEFDMKYERDLGWICQRCISGIESRGGKLIFEDEF